MILLQLSAGQGPAESGRALALALERLQGEAREQSVKLTLLESTPGHYAHCYKSLLLQLEGERALALGQSWQGSLLWICPSPFRPRHRRKNWFFGGSLYRIESRQLSNEIDFQSCRASGAGGQHVNTTDSAVRATHRASGISVRVETERSQHANKKRARALIALKLLDLEQQSQTQQTQQYWHQHWNLERGNPVRIFEGKNFTPAS